jgi:hypothetical protein
MISHGVWQRSVELKRSLPLRPPKGNLSAAERRHPHAAPTSLCPPSPSSSQPSIPAIHPSSELVSSIAQSPILKRFQYGPPASRVRHCAASLHCPSPPGEQCLGRHVKAARYLHHNPRKDRSLTFPAVANRSEIATRIFRTAHELSM